MAQLALCRLAPSDHAALARLLEQDVVRTCYMRSELRLNPGLGSWWGLGGGGALRAALIGGSLVVPWIPDPADAPVLAEAVVHQPPRMIVGPAESVRALVAALERIRRPQQVRDPQPLLVLDHAPEVPASPVRRSTRADLEPLVLAAAAMHREEMGVDPMTVDAQGWRARMITLIDRGWSWVWMNGPEVVFKAELSGWTPEVVQIQGVWTNPRWRRRGVAAAALGAVCASLLREVPLCSLYVNGYNAPALRLYDRLGFTRAGDYSTVMY